LRSLGCGVLLGILRLKGMWFDMRRIESRMQRCDWGLVDAGRGIRGSPGVITRDLIGFC
jgi:hypothetical protein